MEAYYLYFNKKWGNYIMVTISVELFFQILNTILWIFIIFIGYKLICYISDFLSKIVNK